MKRSPTCKPEAVHPSVPFERLRMKSLLGKFLALNVPFALLGLAVFFVVFENFGYRQVEQDFRHGSEQLIDSQTKVFAASLWDLDHERIQLLAESLSVNADVAAVEVADDFGEVLGSSGASVPDAKIPAETTPLGTVISRVIYFEREGQREPVGNLRILFSDDRLQRARVRDLAISITVAVVVMLTTMLAAVLAFRWTIGIPLARLVGAFGADAVGGHHRAEWNSRDEMGSVFSSFNEMRERQETAEQALRRSNDELEHRVASRTRELALARDRAQAADEAKSQFLATMSHEIRTPMTGVMGLVDILLDAEPPADMVDNLNKIKGATQSLLTIINDVLDLSKLEAGKLEIEKIDFDLHRMVREATELFAHRAEEKNLALHLEIADDVPDAVNGDPTRIRQVLVNLVGNAIKFTHEGSVSLGVSLHNGDGRPGVLRLRVIDTGIGIPKDRIDDLFGDFTQADASTTRKYEGTGLGLAISKRLVELMGGEIAAESDPGSGSAFSFTVPYVAATSEVSDATTTAPLVEFVGQRALHVLLAEDNKLNQQIIHATLTRFGHTSVIVENGAEAVKAVARGEIDYDLVLMDVRMPEMNGPDATRAIRKLSRGNAAIPIIAVTADAMEEHRRGYLDAGMNACVTKPIDRNELARVINEVLGENIHVAVEAEQINETSSAVKPASVETAKEQIDTVDDNVLAFLGELEDIASSD
ncbi:MAG: response regulator [Rhodospirillaceae bacterium]|nr:response regulator [Rhodospirillaceae bacterium]